MLILLFSASGTINSIGLYQNPGGLNHNPIGLDQNPLGGSHNPAGLNQNPVPPSQNSRFSRIGHSYVGGDYFAPSGDTKAHLHRKCFKSNFYTV
jgi:hypothetical protein